MRNVADNAGIADVRYDDSDMSVLVRADEFRSKTSSRTSSERRPLPHSGTLITLTLDVGESTASANVHNGPQIPAEFIDRIFEYGVSDQDESAAAGNRGAGLFVAKTYLAKMGGTITVPQCGGRCGFLAAAAADCRQCDGSQHPHS